MTIYSDLFDSVFSSYKYWTDYYHKQMHAIEGLKDKIDAIPTIPDCDVSVSIYPDSTPVITVHVVPSINGVASAEEQKMMKESIADKARSTVQQWLNVPATKDWNESDKSTRYTFQTSNYRVNVYGGGVPNSCRIQEVTETKTVYKLICPDSDSGDQEGENG